MKYLKQYNEGIEKDKLLEISNDVKDICQELKDEGYEVSVVHRNGISVLIYMTDKKGPVPTLKFNGFYFSQISDVAFRLIDYLKDFESAQIKIGQMDDGDKGYKLYLFDVTKYFNDRLSEEHLTKMLDNKYEKICQIVMDFEK